MSVIQGDARKRYTGGRLAMAGEEGESIVDNKGVVSETQFSNYDKATGTVEHATASATFIDVNDMVLMITLERDSVVDIFGAAVCSGDSSMLASECEAGLFIDDVQYATPMKSLQPSIYKTTISTGDQVPLAAGTHTFKMKFKSNTLSLQVRITDRIIKYQVLGK